MFISVSAVPEPTPPPGFVFFSGGMVGLSLNRVPFSGANAECTSIGATFYSATSEADVQDMKTAVATIKSTWSNIISGSK